MQLVTAPGAAPHAWMVFLHGVLGRRTNWASFARKLLAARPDWGAVLVDLRLHGDALAAEPPHTIARAAADLAALEVPRGAIRGVLGHSLGGKVALAYARDVAPSITHAFIVDSVPGPLTDPRARSMALSVVELLAALPRSFRHREDFMRGVETGGASRAIAEWLAMNLVREADGWVLPLDLAAIGELLASHFAEDLWPAVEAPRPGLHVHLIIGGASPLYGPADRARALALAAAGTLTATVIEGAGHWVHVDAPAALHGLVAAALPPFADGGRSPAP